MPLLLPPVIYTSYNNMIQSCVSKFSSLIPSPFSRFVLFSRQNGTRHIITALMSRSQAFAKETTSSYQDEKTSILSNNCGKILCQKTHPRLYPQNPIHPDSRQCTTILSSLIHPPGMYQEIDPHMIIGVKNQCFSLMMR